MTPLEALTRTIARCGAQNARLKPPRTEQPMTNERTDLLPCPVTYEQALGFLEHAFRNIDLPPLSNDDVRDIADGLNAFANTRTPIRSEDTDLVERVARALCAHDFAKQHGYPNEANWRLFIEPARAAIKAASGGSNG